MTNIGESAFSGCSSLTSVTLPDSVTSIGDGAFARCYALESIDVGAGNERYCSVDGVLYNKEKTSLIKCPDRKASVTIPQSVTSIGYSAFYYCKSLTSVTIPDSVTSIGGYAFYGCKSLTSVTIPDSVTSIGEYAFYGCSALTRIIIPFFATSIGNNAFMGCTSLESVTIPETVTTFGDDAFSGRYPLTFRVFSGSAAETYAKELAAENSSIKYELIDIKDINDSSIWVGTDINSPTYDGTEKTIAIDLTDEEINYKMIPGVDYDIEYLDNVNAGTAHIKITAKGYYTGTKDVGFQIDRASISECSVTVSPDSYIYDGEKKQPQVTVKLGETELKENTDYTVEYSNNAEIGTASVTVTGTGNYTGIAFGSFKIDPIPIDKCTVTLEQTEYEYDGYSKTPKATVKYGDVLLEENKDYSLSYSDNTEVGTACVTVSGWGNYSGESKVSFEITPVPKKDIADCAVTVERSSLIFDGSAKEPFVTVEDGNKLLSQDVDYTVLYSDNTEVGTATVTVTGIGDYIGTNTVIFEIVPAPKDETDTDTTDNIVTDTDNDKSSDSETGTDSDKSSDSETGTDSDKSSDTETGTDSDKSSDLEINADSDISRLDSDTDTTDSENLDDEIPKTIVTTFGVLGDMDNDEAITAADALDILRISIGLTVPNDIALVLADVDGDDNVTSGDALEVLRFSIGLSNSELIGKIFKKEVSTGTTIYVKLTGDQNYTPTLYYWGTEDVCQWPGVPMKDTDGDGWYEYFVKCTDEFYWLIVDDKGNKSADFSANNDVWAIVNTLSKVVVYDSKPKV